MKKYETPKITNLSLKETCENDHPCRNGGIDGKCLYLPLNPGKTCNYKGEAEETWFICNFGKTNPYN